MHERYHVYSSELGISRSMKNIWINYLFNHNCHFHQRYHHYNCYHYHDYCYHFSKSELYALLMLFFFMVDKTFAKTIITLANWQDIGETMASNIVVSNGADITFLFYFPERRFIFITNYHCFPTRCSSLQTTILTCFMKQLIRAECNIPKASSYWWNHLYPNMSTKELLRKTFWWIWPLYLTTVSHKWKISNRMFSRNATETTNTTDTNANEFCVYLFSLESINYSSIKIASFQKEAVGVGEGWNLNSYGTATVALHIFLIEGRYTWASFDNWPQILL